MITKDLKIAEIIRIKEDAPQILMSFGMGCVGCPSSQAETIEDASKVHGLNLEKLLEALNK
jgi:hybrid cluster-associated redox disulfide protein